MGAFLGLAATARSEAGALLGTEGTVTTLFVLALAEGQPTWGLARLSEVAVGGGVAIAVNALILPPTYRPEVGEAVHLLARRLVEHTHVAVADLLGRPGRRRSGHTCWRCGTRSARPMDSWRRAARRGPVPGRPARPAPARPGHPGRPARLQRARGPAGHQRRQRQPHHRSRGGLKRTLARRRLDRAGRMTGTIEVWFNPGQDDRADGRSPTRSAGESADTGRSTVR